MTVQNTSHAVMAQRREPLDSLDDFPTPPWATRALIEHVIGVDRVRGATCWEPACNRGYMVRPLREYFECVRATDVHDYGWNGQDETGDFLLTRPDAVSLRPRWIITNPPFRLAAQFAHHALHVWKPYGIAMLVRTAFLEGQERYRDLFSVTPPSIVAQFVERVPMVRGRHDPEASTATSYCWLIWAGAGVTETRFQWIPPCRKKLQRASDS